MWRKADVKILEPVNRVLLAVALLACPGVALAQRTAPAPAAPQAAPSLAGRWELNAQESDSPGAAMPAQGESEGGRAGSGGRGGGGYGGGTGGMTGRGGMGGGGGRGGGATESTATRDAMRRAMEASRVLLIVQHETHLSLTDEEGRVVTLTPDGTKVQEQQFGLPVERTTKWDGRSLVTMTKLKGGAKVTQTFTKVAEGLQLVVVTKIEGGQLSRPIEVKRVYDQAFQEPLESVAR